MHVDGITWAITIIVLVGILLVDFWGHVRRDHTPSMKEAGLWLSMYVGLATVFGIFLWVSWPAPGDPHKHGLEFFSGYFTELSLSIDNLFIFALIISSFKVPRELQQKVLAYGIALAIVFRGIFIALGAAAINAWSDIFYLFGIFMLYTAIKLVVDEVRDAPETDVDDMFVVRTLRRFVPVSSEFVGHKMVAKVDGKRMVTPMLLALVTLGAIDLLFALDSIPAIYGLTQEPYIVFTTNVFALMGLRQMYFLLDGLLERLVYLPYGLGVILGFIGVKLLFHALEENNLPFINGGEDVHVPEISTVLSLGVIVVTLTVTVFASIIKDRRDRAAGGISVRNRM
ncbi:TerC/Alx family metal homeostasis membrane protein [uncultured Corynebacterium sp.]|uniref:TerC/Alx family metal homeostasis membrane protein n=1 Tax=uncultured Corynebacterium sp. TaxID=159447 RepID=UPI0025E033CA|nr:TerC/Alx family metal homeostasis membrane protein [uncultured Corynebacterium sp.]